MDTLRQDLRFAVRQLAAHRQFAVAALLVLGLGLGANATIFGLTEAVLFRPIPGVRQPERVVQARMKYSVTSYPAYRDLREDGRGVIALASVSDRRMALSGDGHDQLVGAQVVSDNFFAVLGVPAAVGRLFTAADGQRGAAPVVVLSDPLWRTTFGGDPSVIGRTVRLNDRPVTVIGVAERGFRGLWLTSAPDLWVTVAAWPALAPSQFAQLDIESRGLGWLTLVGRLAPGVSAEQAAAVLNASIQRQQRAYPREMQGEGTLTLQSSIAAATGGAPRGAVVGFMGVLTTVVGLVLLLVCANVANLLLARAAARRREFGVRVALGASRARLVRQLLTESVVLALAASVVAFLIADLSLGLLARATIGGVSLDRLPLEPDARVVSFTALLAMGCALLFGAAPARQTMAVDLTPALRDGTAGGGSTRSPLRGTLLAVQLALSLVLLIGAGLFARALQRALAIDPGFSPDHVALARVDVGLAHYDGPRAEAYFAQVGDRLAALQDLASFAWTTDLPLSSDMDEESVRIPGYQPPPGEKLLVEESFVSAGYFRTMHIPIQDGREFGPQDAPGSPSVAIVNATMAARYWPGRSAIGQQLEMLGDTLTIVGVARDVAYHALGEPPRPYAYANATQFLRKGSGGPVLLVARTHGEPEAMLAGIRAVLLSADPHVTPFQLGVFDDQVKSVLLPQRAGAVVLAAFSLLALVVALVGVHGVVSYAVSRRTREIGIRVALGARPERVVRVLLGHHMRAISAGLLAGLALAAAGTRALSSFLYGVSATDFPTFAGAAVALALAALLAAALPARRAAAVDPMTALRYE